MSHGVEADNVLDLLGFESGVLVLWPVLDDWLISFTGILLLSLKVILLLFKSSLFLFELVILSIDPLEIVDG